MAFVSPTATSFLGNKVGPRVCHALPSSRRTSKAAAPCSGKSVLHMSYPPVSFTSIDDPGEAVVLADDSVECKHNVVYAVYKHVFGNAYLMESERAELATIDSDFLLGRLTVRDFVRALGKSEAYRERFFDRCGPYRFVELNCKHFLGRGPNSQKEVSFHVQKLINEGYDAEIDSYIDSEEYDELFSNETVPRFIYKGTYVGNDSFNRMNIMREHWDGCSTSTKYGSTFPRKPAEARLVLVEGNHVGNPMAIRRGIRADHYYDPILPLNNTQPLPTNARAPVRLRIKVADNHYKVFETSGYTDPAPRMTADWNKTSNKKFTEFY